MGKVFNALNKHRKEIGDHKIEDRPLDKDAENEPLSFNSDGKRDAKKAPFLRRFFKSKKQSEKKRQEKGESEGESRTDHNLVVIHRPQSFEAEQFKILRTNILFPPEGVPPRSIMVTSALPGEGKSFVAANLAASIAQNINEYVLLIDCDLRKPSIHTQYGLDGTPGLAEYLVGESTVDGILLKTEIEKLTILPAGASPKNPAELLSSTRMKTLLKEVRDRYSDRYIIIDSPPPRLTAETSAIANFVDGILLIIRFGETPRRDVVKLVEDFGKEKIIGTIVNRFESLTLGQRQLKKYNHYYSK